MKFINNKIRKMKNLPKWFICLLYYSSRLLRMTLRVKISDPHNFLSPDNTTPCILISWHNRTMMLPVFVPRHFTRKCAILNSMSRDGQYMADYMGFLGVTSIRGSSSKGGAKALAGLQSHMDDGGHVMLTPDGPRGPKYQLKDGTLWLASKQQCPIYPISINSKSHKTLDKSWDKTQIPWPFSKVELIVGEPIYLPENLADETLEEQREILRLALMAITKWDTDDAN
ncbi:MAG: lysophospholipid acyltransferase family protein [Lentisphaeria bacterium]|nr:lysophospholipid acyltransferase family protein [Lentisphaeria bacterium]NQZ68950.1 lysophospholipid acyltransferase family protein [Lentisphaeria bacterium]